MSSALISIQSTTEVQRPVKINRQSWHNYQCGQINRPKTKETSEDTPAPKRARLEKDTLVSTTSRKRKLMDAHEDAPVLKRARMELEKERDNTVNSPPRVKGPSLETARRPTVWIIGDSYIRRGEEMARRSLGADLGVRAQVTWFGRGGLRWLPAHEGPPVCYQPATPLALGSSTPKGDGPLPEMVLGVNGCIVHPPDIVFNNPRLFLKDNVNLSPWGNDIFLSDIAECLKVLIQ